MAKAKTLAEVNEQIAKTETQIRQGENYVSRRMQEINQQERKTRTRRLIERGAIVENLINNAAALTNEQIQAVLVSALSTQVSREEVEACHKLNTSTANTGEYLSPTGA